MTNQRVEARKTYRAIERFIRALPPGTEVRLSDIEAFLTRKSGVKSANIHRIRTWLFGPGTDQGLVIQKKIGRFNYWIVQEVADE